MADSRYESHIDVAVSATNTQTKFTGMFSWLTIRNQGDNNVHFSIGVDAATTSDYYLLPGESMTLDASDRYVNVICAATKTSTVSLLGRVIG